MSFACAYWVGEDHISFNLDLKFVTEITIMYRHFLKILRVVFYSAIKIPEGRVLSLAIHLLRG